MKRLLYLAALVVVATLAFAPAALADQHIIDLSCDTEPPDPSENCDEGGGTAPQPNALEPQCINGVLDSNGDGQIDPFEELAEGASDLCPGGGFINDFSGGLIQTLEYGYETEQWISKQVQVPDFNQVYCGDSWNPGLSDQVPSDLPVGTGGVIDYAYGFDNVGKKASFIADIAPKSGGKSVGSLFALPKLWVC